MFDGWPVSPPTSAGDDGLYKCYIDWDSKLWEVFWTGSAKYPDFSHLKLHPVDLSDEVSTTWSSSKAKDFGSRAFIRVSHEGAFPVVKIAHPDTEARDHVQHEFELMRTLSSFPGVANVDSESLTDSEGVYGFRLEELRAIDFENIKDWSSKVREVVKALHKHGYCHGDLSPSNVMINDVGQIVLIDLAFSGVIGEDIPKHIPRWVYTNSTVFDATADEADVVE
ncbi:hypothetical protein LTR49_028128 [Elasticomyces elasticus]|nr:hypothetical protein LTR49_028128 [Elasticomyces elasticus]